VANSAESRRADMRVEPFLNLRQDEELVEGGVGDRRIGEILCGMGVLNAGQVQAVLERQHKQGRLFGENAVRMRYARREEVISALSQQFQFPYASDRSDVKLHEELVMANAPFSDEVECFRSMRSELLMGVLSPTATERSALAIVSPEIGDGKTFVIANLAVAFSQARGRTLVIDADMRSPRLHEVFGIENQAGLSTVLSGRTETRVIQPVKFLPNLYMLPAGTLPPNPTELIHQPAFEIVLNELTRKFDCVLVDTPAASHGSDASVIAARCGVAMVVARKGSSRVGSLQALLARLDRASVRLAGVMMNNV
jgi:protein-tyrosine kinase